MDICLPPEPGKVKAARKRTGTTVSARRLSNNHFPRTCIGSVTTFLLNVSDLLLDKSVAGEAPLQLGYSDLLCETDRDALRDVGQTPCYTVSCCNEMEAYEYQGPNGVLLHSLPLGEHHCLPL